MAPPKQYSAHAPICRHRAILVVGGHNSRGVIPEKSLAEAGGLKTGESTNERVAIQARERTGNRAFMYSARQRGAQTTATAAAPQTIAIMLPPGAEAGSICVAYQYWN